MTEPRVDREAGLLLATPATMDLLAGVAAATPAQRDELERAGWLQGGRLPDDLEPLAQTWGAPIARIVLRVRQQGLDTTVTGVTDGDLAVLLAPAAADSELRHVLASPFETLPRWVAMAIGLGPRPEHGEAADLVPLGWDVVTYCLGFSEEDSLRRQARERALMMAPEESVAAVFAADALRVTVTVTSTTGAFEEETVDFVDAGDGGLWLVAALPPDAEAAAAIPFSTRGIWRLLARALDAPIRHVAAPSE